MSRPLRNPVLHRDDPDRAPLSGNVKVTRQDWIDIAMDVLIRDGVDRVKILTLAEAMGVSRSSFYWYFGSRRDLLEALLTDWQERNTAAMVAQAETAAPTITAAICNVFRCTANPVLFDTALDFAIRDWARRDAKVRHTLDRSDATREAALAAMFRRYDYPDREAETRAKVLYYMQLGYDFAGPPETAEIRLDRVPDYLRIFSGQEPLAAEVEEFTTYATRFQSLSTARQT
ncbi:TetR/AcrR family transcriptional regulator [Aestuariivita sp.]|jgi:AcrR family transcriptional regulator|uniref:TetR/AcrR family transcriptional regulator n=1 Tax=Aestuariivita sp. TaxID=1872407 RepID=UPI00216E654A|nr:TetR/AcrR family transcriptional regulator [Aestuariivita sp.]MCE8008020.1 TetR/AcrR family transcriptional regulator [Aestuariivita sp.]